MNRLSMFLRALAIVGIAEFLVMLLLPFLGLPGGIWKAAIDAAVLVALSAPFLYVWVARGVAERLSEKYIQGFLENARDLVQSVTPEGRFLYVNRAWRETLGYREDEVPRLSLFDIIHPDHRIECQRLMQRVLGGERPDNVEAVFVAKDGRNIFVSGNVHCVFEGGKPMATQAIFRDVTDRKRAEEQLRMFSQAVEQGPTSIVITDPTGAIEYVNPLFTRLTGYTLEEAIGKNPRILKSGKVPQEIYQELWETISNGGEWRGELCNKKKNGELYWESASISPVRDTAGAITHFIGVKENITERKKVEEALRESEEKFRGLFQGAAEGILVVNFETQKFVYANPAVCRMLGYTEEELVHLGVSDLHRQQDLERVAAEFMALARGENTLASAVPFLRKDGTTIYADIRGSRLVVDGKDCSVGFLTDITERKQAEAEREKALTRQQGVSLLQRSLLAPVSLVDKLRTVTDSIVRVFDADFCRIWLIRPGDLCQHGCMHAAVQEGPHVCRDRGRCLHLLASSGRYTHTDGQGHGRVPFGCYKIGLIASGKEHRFITNDVQNDPRVHNREWARALGLVSFAGYQLRVPGEETLGVLALFSKHSISADEDAMLDALGSAAAMVVRQATAEEALRRSETKFRTLYDSTSDAVMLLDEKGFFDCNKAALATFGCATREDLCSQHPADMSPPGQPCGTDSLTLAKQRIATAIEKGSNHFEWIHKRADTGETFPADVLLNAMELDGKPIVQAVVRDITERKGAEREIEEANRKLKSWLGELERRNQETTLLNEMGDLLLASISPEEAHAVIAQYAQRLFPDDSGALFAISASRDLVEAVTVWGQTPPRNRVFATGDCWALRRGRLHSVETFPSGLVCKHLAPTEEKSYLCVPMMAQGEALGVLHVQAGGDVAEEFQDLEKRRTENWHRLAVTVAEHLALALANLNLRDTLRTQSIRDPLTGLFNRRYMEESLEREMRRAARNQKPLGAIMIDLDHFKRFNDTFGHEAGDTLLRAFGVLLQKRLRGEDIACRYGGEEFTLILPEAALEVVRQRGEELRERAKHLDVQHLGRALGAITLSLGIAVFPEHGTTPEAILRAADAALYRAKSEGRDRVVAAETATE